VCATLLVYLISGRWRRGATVFMLDTDRRDLVVLSSKPESVLLAACGILSLPAWHYKHNTTSYVCKYSKILSPWQLQQLWLWLVYSEIQSLYSYVILVSRRGWTLM